MIWNMSKDGESIYVYKCLGLTLYYLPRYPDIKGKYVSCGCFYYIRKRIISDMKKDKHYIRAYVTVQFLLVLIFIIEGLS